MKNFLSLLCYRVFFLALLPVLLIVFIVRSINHSDYRHRLSERLGILPKGISGGGIVIHAASVGEVIAIKAFVEKVLIAYPEIPITVTTFTPTGSEQVKKFWGERVQHCYFPLDVFCCSWLFLNKLRPQALVIMETELWPNIIAQAADRNIKLLLINARLSERSCRRYKKLAHLVTPTIKRFDKILAQSDENRNNYLALGAQQQQCVNSGNLKFDIASNQSIAEKQHELAQYLASDRPIWLVASTHPGDEEIVLAAYKAIIKHFPTLLLIMVPRHPERFTAVAKLCQSKQLSFVRRSEKEQVTDNTQIWLFDTLGELMPAFSLASIVTMGGSFSDIGGHNPLEPALFKKPIIVGPDMSNFNEVLEQLFAKKGVIQLTNKQDITTELPHVVQQLLQDHQLATSTGENAYTVVQDNQGASEKSLLALQALMNNTTTS
ncbi:lipid IV(A) 3-deoxy-D-manno-octulosonic acid transferase [Colwelliaceae bacterium 6471]